MNLFLPFMAVIVFAMPSAEEKCQCNFPRQFWGYVDIYSNRRPLVEILNPRFPDFEVDLDLQRAVFYLRKTKYFNDYSVYIQDLENKTMYEFPYLNGRPTGNCTAMDMPADLLIPSCLPVGWTEVDDPYTTCVYGPSQDDELTKYYLRDNTSCVPEDVYHAYHGSATGIYILDLEIVGYKLLTNGSLLKMDTQGCSPIGHFDTHYKKTQ